jgi:Polyketide cyclase / dehydrase and lipid transport
VTKTAVVVKSKTMKAGVDRVWDALVDWENERKYWGNIRDIKTISSDATNIEREATVGPRAFAQKMRQRIVLDPKKPIKLSMASDQINGERSIILVPLSSHETRVDVAWDFKLSDVPGFAQMMVKGQLSKVTDEALEKIAAAVEEREARVTTPS